MNRKMAVPQCPWVLDNMPEYCYPDCSGAPSLKEEREAAETRMEKVKIMQEINDQEQGNQ